MPRALMAVAPRTTELVEYDEPPLGDRDVRIRSEFAAPKHGTESHAYLDDQRRLARRFHPEYRIFVPDEDSGVTPFPRRLGNMTVGTVTEVGAGVTRFKVGDRVYGHLPIRETHTVPEDGPFKSTAAGPREQELHPVPPELSPEQVVLLDPAHFALAAVRDANVRVGERVAVFGLGAIGLLILQMTILSGAVTVYAIDPLPSRRALAAASALPPATTPPPATWAWRSSRPPPAPASTCDRGERQLPGAAGRDPRRALLRPGGDGVQLPRPRHRPAPGRGVAPDPGHGAQQHAGVGQPLARPPAVDDRRVEETALQLMRDGRLQSDGLCTRSSPSSRPPKPTTGSRTTPTASSSSASASLPTRMTMFLDVSRRPGRGTINA